MVSLDDAVVARLSAQGHHFEVLVDPEQILHIREGKVASVTEHLVIDAVFKDAGKGDHASEEILQKVFQSADVNEVAKRIIREGDIQLTTEQRRQFLDAKRKQIVAEICRYAWNPQTKTPHPPARIERAMEEAKVHIDPFKGTDVQVQEVIKAIRPLLPISIERIQVAFKIPASYTGKAYGEVKRYGDLIRETWQNDGALVGVIEIPAGQQGDLFDHLNALTKGEVETKLLK